MNKCLRRRWKIRVWVMASLALIMGQMQYTMDHGGHMYASVAWDTSVPGANLRSLVLEVTALLLWHSH